MSELIVLPTLATLLSACASCFQARSYFTFQWLVLGWVESQGRRTLTTVALASGGLAQRHISVFHRFFSRRPGVWMRWGTRCSGWRSPGFQPTNRW